MENEGLNLAGQGVTTNVRFTECAICVPGSVAVIGITYVPGATRLTGYAIVVHPVAVISSTPATNIVNPIRHRRLRFHPSGKASSAAQVNAVPAEQPSSRLTGRPFTSAVSIVSSELADPPAVNDTVFDANASVHTVASLLP